MGGRQCEGDMPSKGKTHEKLVFELLDSRVFQQHFHILRLAGIVEIGLVAF